MTDQQITFIDMNPCADSRRVEMWLVTDDGGDYGPPEEELEELEEWDAEQELEERADYYKSIGRQVIARKRGVPFELPDRSAYVWEITFRITALPIVVADGFNPTDHDEDRSDREILDYISGSIGAWGEEHITVNVMRSSKPDLRRILLEQGYNVEQVDELVKAATAEAAKSEAITLVDMEMPLAKIPSPEEQEEQEAYSPIDTYEDPAT